MRESARPMERIEGIKILSVNGLGSHGSGNDESNGGLPEQVVNSALRFRAQAPLIDGLLKEIGVDIGGGVDPVTRSLLTQGSEDRGS